MSPTPSRYSRYLAERIHHCHPTGPVQKVNLVVASWNLCSPGASGRFSDRSWLVSATAPSSKPRKRIISNPTPVPMHPNVAHFHGLPHGACEHSVQSVFSHNPCLVLHNLGGGTLRELLGPTGRHRCIILFQCEVFPLFLSLAFFPKCDSCGERTAAFVGIPDHIKHAVHQRHLKAFGSVSLGTFG